MLANIKVDRFRSSSQDCSSRNFRKNVATYPVYSVSNTENNPLQYVYSLQRSQTNLQREIDTTMGFGPKHEKSGH